MKTNLKMADFNVAKDVYYVDVSKKTFFPNVN